MEQISNIADQHQTRRDPLPSSAETKTENNRSDSPLQLQAMITMVALTQFPFLTLGIVLLKILIHSSASVPGSIQWLNVVSLSLFSIPAICTVYATICVRIDKHALSLFVAQIAGIVLAVVSFLFLAAVVFYLPAQF